MSVVDPLLTKEDIKLVNCQSLGKMFWRYIPLSRLVEMLERKELAFVCPILWEDPFERLYLKTDFSRLDYKQGMVYCLCGRGSGNEDAAWKVYRKDCEPTICVRFNLKKLFPQIRAYLKDYYNIYYSKVCYAHTTNEIKNIPKNQLRSTSNSKPFGEEAYISLMSLKRQSFAYEEEYRIFLVPQGDFSFGSKDNLLWIPIEYDIFERFTLEPSEMVNTRMSKLLSQDRDEEYKHRKEEIESFLKKKIGNNVKFYESSLYRDVKPIEKV